MEKIKRFFCHLFGGMTRMEVEDFVDASTGMYTHAMFRTLREHLDSINGIPADKWCKETYRCVKFMEERHKGKTELDAPYLKNLFTYEAD